MVMFQYLVRKNGLSGPLEREGIRAEELKFIESLMDPRVAPPDEKVIKYCTVKIHKRRM